MLDPTPDALPSRAALDTHIAQPVNTLWIFGYGSLVWRPAFPHRERRAAFIEGWERRFWQGSTDHRGVPGAPGRVVTLVPCEGKTCWGMAYHVPGEDVAATLDQLDHRERGGYARRNVTLEFRDGERVDGLIYVATPANHNFLGPAELTEIAKQVRDASGPSGTNQEYVLRLADALREIDAEDPHVFALEALLR